MDDASIMDWSFIMVLVLVALLVTGLTWRARQARRRRKQDERRAAKRAHRQWLASSAAPLDTADTDEPARDR